MENKENQAIYQKLKRLYNAAKFKNKKDENAFLGLLRIYMGRNSGTGTVNEDLTSMESRKIAGDSFFDSTYRDSEIGQEAQTRIAQLNESYVQHFNEFKQRRIDTRKTRIGKAIQNSELNKTYNTKVADRILPLALAYSGRNQNGNKKFKTVEQRYEQADKVLMQLGGKLSQVEKKAARDLYNMFKAQDNKEYERTKDNRTRQLDARRDALRIQHANTINHSLESLVTKDVKLETALERTVIPEKKNSGIMGYISNAIKKPWGKVAAAGLGLVTAGLIVYGASQIRGCNGKQPTKPIAIIAGIASETKTEEKELKFTPDPFKPVLKTEEALAETGKGKTPERTRCIDWEKSKLEQEIQSYQLKDGTFKAKLGKNLAEAMRKDSSIILRLISNNKLSEEAKHLGITYLIYET
ncbi:MAG: hypothetical protein ABIH63_00930, partial [archaeon]